MNAGVAVSIAIAVVGALGYFALLLALGYAIGSLFRMKDVRDDESRD
jgi:EamA domain-containing membrane protein RarD